MKITGYYCAGPKFYLLTGKHVVTGEPYSSYKIKGVSLNMSTETNVNPESIRRLVMGETTAGGIARLETPHFIIRKEKKTGKLVNNFCMKICRVTNTKRLFYAADGLSVPFGFVDL